MEERLRDITRCMDELAKARRDMRINPLGACISQMDWLSELHHTLYL
jgi:hypothetical protein